MRGLLIIIAAVLAAGSAGAQDFTTLECVGGGARSATSTLRAGEHSGTISSRETYSDRLMVQFSDERGRVRFPQSILPSLTARGRGEGDGWWGLSNYTITDDEIRGRVNLNWLNRPYVVIDRRTGNADITGMGGHFTGRCASVSMTERRF